MLSSKALAELSVWRAEQVPAARRRLADVTVASVPGLTTEVSTTVPYTLTWQWADALHEVGNSGMLYTARFGMDEAVALFGPAGVPADAPAATRAAAVTHLASLPGEFLSGVGDVGVIGQLERATGP